MHIFIAALCIKFKKLEITQISINCRCLAELWYILRVTFGVSMEFNTSMASIYLLLQTTIQTSFTNMNSGKGSQTQKSAYYMVPFKKKLKTGK